MTNPITESQAERIRAFIKEREEQRRGVEPDRSERIAAIDGLMEVASRMEAVTSVVESIYLQLAGYIEVCGKDAPHEVEHTAWCLDMLIERCKALSDDAYSAERAARKLIA